MFNIFNLMKYPYRYVEPCPNCGSRCTGRYEKEPMTRGDMEYIELQSLKHGEIVRFLYRVPEENVFCVDCNHKWSYDVRTRFLSKDDIMKEIDERGTQGAYEELREEIEERRREEK